MWAVQIVKICKKHLSQPSIIHNNPTLSNYSWYHSFGTLMFDEKVKIQNQCISKDLQSISNLIRMKRFNWRSTSIISSTMSMVSYQLSLKYQGFISYGRVSFVLLTSECLPLVDLGTSCMKASQSGL